MFLCRILVTFIIISYSFFAQGKYRDFCQSTKAAMNDYEPEQFEPSNNLLRKGGKSEVYCGRKIVIHGRVLDQNCVPVPDAKIYIWQAACNGKYPYTPLREIVDAELIAINPASSFTGNGTATTDNNGEFIFITTYPVAMHELSPHVNVRVEHYMLGSLQTILQFEGKKAYNPRDSSVKDIDSVSIPIYNFEIIIPGLGIKNYSK